MTMKENVKYAAKHLLTEYLQDNGLKRTPERYIILDAAYSFDGAFDIRMLQTRLETEVRFRICRATLYNNIGLLEKAGLLTLYQSKPRSMFKRAVN